MYDRSKNQYIFKLSNGKTINFFFKENTGLCSSVLNKRNMWTESTVVAKDCLRSFGADIEVNDNIHILYQDTKGNINTIIYDNEYKINPILNSKNAVCYDKNLTVLCTTNGVYYFYVLEHLGSKLLSYQYTRGDLGLSQPKVIDYCLDAKYPYSVFLDSNNSIVIFYFSADSRQKYPGFKTINTDKDTISDFYPLSTQMEKNSTLGGFCDSDGTYHFLWDRKCNGKFELCYINKKIEDDALDPEKVISTSAFSYSNASIVRNSIGIICYWTSDSIINYSLSSDGRNFSAPEKYTYFEGRPFYCITYKSNLPDRHYPLNGFPVPANFINGYKLGFSDTSSIKVPVQKSLEIPTEQTTPTLNLEIINEMEALKKQNKLVDDLDIQIKSQLKLIDDLKDNIIRQNNIIDTLEKNQIKLEADLLKALNRIEILEIEQEKVKDIKLNPNLSYNHSKQLTPKPDTLFKEKLADEFQYIENQFDDDYFVQNPQIEAIKREIAETIRIGSK